MVSVDWEKAIATGHVVSASTALLVGAAVLLLPKGTRTHRVIGAVYVLALVLVNVAALSLHRENAFGVFHALAVASLVTIGVGLSPLRFGRRSLPVIVTHAYCMAWSYAGLVAAGCGQLVVAVGHGDGAWVVPVVIGTVLSISGVVIFGRVPTTLDHVLAVSADAERPGAREPRSICEPASTHARMSGPGRPARPSSASSPGGPRD